MGFQFGSIIQQISALAEQFRAEHLSETATFTHRYTSRTIHVTPLSRSVAQYTIDYFGSFDEQDVFVGFAREFFQGKNFVPPQSGDTITVNGRKYIVTAQRGKPSWVYAEDDPGKRTIWINTRKDRNDSE